MTGTLRELRGEIITQLGPLEDLTLYDHVPARAMLPCIILVPGSPYIEQGQTMGGRVVRFGVLMLNAPAPNQYDTHGLDERIEQIQQLLDADGWTVERVEQPTIQELNGSEVLASEIIVATEATF